MRIGPNDILFYTPQAVMDIYGKMNKGQEVFVKTNLMDFGQGDLGFSWQPNPAIRKATGRKILPAFSNKANKNKEPLVHAYIDLFVSQMLALGNRAEGLLMNDWLYWLAVDMSADLAYGREMTHLKDGLHTLSYFTHSFGPIIYTYLGTQRTNLLTLLII